MKGHDMTGTDPIEQPTHRPDPHDHTGAGEPQDQGTSTSRAGIPMPSAGRLAGSGA